MMQADMSSSSSIAPARLEESEQENTVLHNRIPFQGFKRPIIDLVSSSDSDSDEPSQDEDDRTPAIIDLTNDWLPDLEMYFQQLKEQQRLHGIPETTTSEIVDICRTFANYKARTARQPKRLKAQNLKK